MTAEDRAAIGTLVAQASVIKQQVTALGVQVEAFEQEAQALGRRMALETKAEPIAEPVKEPPKRRHYGPQKVG